jgi:hypothetical protein
MKKLIRFAPFTLFMPLLASAQLDLTYFETSGGGIADLIGNVLVPLVFGIAVLMFLWGVFKAFILGGSDEEKQKEGKQLMVYAIVGFVLMVALWGIVSLVVDIFGLNPGAGYQPPQVLP